MNMNLDIDIDSIKNPSTMVDMSPHLIAEKFHSLLINPDMTTDMAVQKIHDRWFTRFQDAVKSDLKTHADYNTRKQNLTQELKQLKSESTRYINSKKAALGTAEKIVEMRNNLLRELPESVRNIFDDYGVLSPDAWIKRVVNKLSFMEKIRFQRNKMREKYSELVQQCEQGGYDYIPDDNTLKRLSNNVEHQANSYNKNIADLQKRISDIDKEIERYDAKIAKVRTEYTGKMNDEVKQFVSVFHDDARRRTKLQKIPPFVNMQGLNQPVAFFQNIAAEDMPEKYIDEIADLLRRVGLPVAVGNDAAAIENPATYVLRRGKGAKSDIELMTPFFSPGAARTDISAVMKYLASYGVNFIGVTHPATQSQIDPRVNETCDDNPDVIATLVRKKLRGSMSRDDFGRKYSQARPNAGQYLFRGHNFITRDKNSSYATPTWRLGRSGLAYATEDAVYAYGYSGGQNINFMAGETVKPQYLHTSDGDMPVGFLTVFKRSKKNLIVDNTDLEAMNVQHEFGGLKNLVNQKHQNPETALSMAHNPVVARYMVSGEKIIQIDENDAEWGRIMDYFAPNLHVTHTDEYGRAFMRRLDRVRGEMHDNNGVVKTYDIPDAQLDKMVLSKEELLKIGRAKIQKMKSRENTYHMPSHTAQI